jgi:hypothetical protein
MDTKVPGKKVIRKKVGIENIKTISAWRLDKNDYYH